MRGAVKGAGIYWKEIILRLRRFFAADVKKYKITSDDLTNRNFSYIIRKIWENKKKDKNVREDLHD